MRLVVCLSGSRPRLCTTHCLWLGAGRVAT